MVDKSTDHRNDVMVWPFVFHFLAYSIFPETLTEMVVKNYQCYCKKTKRKQFFMVYSLIDHIKYRPWKIVTDLLITL